MGLFGDVSPAEIAIEHVVQRCSVVYIHAFVTVDLEELGELIGYVTIPVKLPVELFERVLDALIASFPDFLI